MSHAVVLTISAKVLIPGALGLMKALADTGLECLQQSTLRTEDGKDHDVDAVVHDARTGAKVGVKFDPKTGETRLIAHDSRSGGARGKALADRIVQHVAYGKALEELRRKGYQITKQETKADGSIAVVAQKWR